ncbi:MAG: isoprenylcysteine carboxylmethyltransferase family protein [Candidatus Omnitrophica bacterium]|nr:isoprenylcysteine carboxylmethyltransferase family protein [Candidatus Omnitrophota bacterium]
MKKDLIRVRRIMLTRLVGGFFLVFSLLFLCAGRIDYWQGWGLVLVSAALLARTCFLIKDKYTLLQERVEPGSGMKWWDKIFLLLFILSFLSVIALAGLESGRFHRTGALPGLIYPLGYLLLFLSHYVTISAMCANDYFSSIVRIQKDRDHKVIQEGLYGIIRHPGYSGGILLGFAVAFMLGSRYALIPASTMALLLIVRTYLEEITLEKNLPGYTEYTKKVKYRIVPGLW